PKLDLSNELYGWPQVIAAVREEARATGLSRDEQNAVVIVGPHWVICAQLEAALRGELPVGCDTPIPDDFDTWWPRARWRAADVVVWVHDARFGAPVLATHAPLRAREVQVRRDGRVVRTFKITVLARRALATSAFTPPPSPRDRPRGAARDL